MSRAVPSVAARLELVDRRTCLVACARVLESRQPQRQVFCRVHIGNPREFMPANLEVVAIFKWPGLVEVTDRNTGELIARSLPGQPAALDESALPHG